MAMKNGFKKKTISGYTVYAITRRWWGKSERGKRNQNLNFKQNINQNSSIIWTNEARNNPYKLQSKSMQILDLFYQHKIITKKLRNKLIKLL